MYHELTLDKTKEYVERFPELKKGLIELCHAFKLKVLTHNHNEMVQQEETVQSNYGDSPSAPKFIRNHLRFLLVDSFGFPVGTFYTKDGVNKENDYAVAYHFTSDLIAKDRGRGLDRRTRESISIPALIKVLKKDNIERPDHFKSVYGKHMWYDVQSNIGNKVGGRYRNVSLDTDSQIALVDYLDKNKIIVDSNIIKDIQRLRDNVAENEKIKAKRDEIFSTFQKTISFILCFRECPMMIGKASFVRDENGDGKYSIHPDVKHYLSPDDVPDTYKQLMVDFKMWLMRHEKESDIRYIESNTPFKVLPICDEGYDQDLNIVSDHSSIHVLNPFTEMRVFIVPDLEVANVN